MTAPVVDRPATATGRRIQRPARTTRPAPQGAAAVLSTSSTMVAIVCLWALLHLLLLAHVSHARSQDLLFREFRAQLAAATAPIDGTADPGAPVALLRIPKLGVEEVVVEGTAAGDLFAGPGHKRNTVLPGQVGTSTVYGRATTYGGPFQELTDLVEGDLVEVVMSQGEVSFRVLGVRRAGDPVPPTRAPKAARLTLVTAEGSGPMARLMPGDAVYVDAEAAEGFASPGGYSPVVPESEEALATGSSALPTLCLYLALLLALTLGVIAARQRWHTGLVWVVAAPIAIALSWATTDAAMRLLPNLV